MSLAATLAATLVATAASLIALQTAAAAPTPTIKVAILGDSLATGAATHPALTFDAGELWSVFTGKVDLKVPKTAPRRLWPASREFFGGSDWVFRNLIQTLSRQYLDTEEYSWGYQLAEQLQLPVQDLAIAAEDGARMQDVGRQLERVLAANGNVVPEKIFLLYTGNDLCAPNVPSTTPVSEFRHGLREGLASLLEGGRTFPAGGTDVYVVGYLGILQLMDSDEILAKRVRAFGKELNCRELRAQGFRAKAPEEATRGLPEDAWYFAMVMPPNPAGYCPTLFGPALDRASASPSALAAEDAMHQLANKIRDFRDASAKTVQELTELVAKAPAKPALRFHYLAGTETVGFGAEDIAGDCFHLSREGHAKIATAIAASIPR